MAKGSKGGRSAPMTAKAASRIQTATSKATGGTTPKGSFSTRAQSAAAHNSKQS